MKNERKALLICFAVFAIAFAAMGIIVKTSSEVRQDYNLTESRLEATSIANGEDSAENQDDKTAGDEKKAKTYMLKARAGDVVVYYSDQLSEPIIDTGIEVGSLRSVDKNKIYRGIEVESFDEVLRLIEDLNS